ncbi:MAG: DUF2723 domain-containing protein [Deltaproteobacteria bacterium]|nr:DUF2723 domain-containing protein [Deltaproteobacteria bacterium]
MVDLARRLRGLWRSALDRLAALAAAAACLACYLSFAEPFPGWLDSPELLRAALRAGIFHPPGSPLVVLCGAGLDLAPGGAAGLLSPLWAAAAVYLLVRIFQLLWQRLGPERRGGRAARLGEALGLACFGLAFGLSAGAGSQAVRAEVYSPALALLLGSLASLLRLLGSAGPRGPSQNPLAAGNDLQQLHPTTTALRTARPANKRVSNSRVSSGSSEAGPVARAPVRTALRASALLGMGLAVHPCVALCALPALAAAAQLRPGLYFRPALLARHLAFGLLGAAPLLLLPAMVHDWSDLRWGDPTSLAGWLRFVTGATFSPAFAPTSSSVSAGMGRLAGVLVCGLGWAPIGAALAGLYLLARCQLRLCLALIGTAALGAASLLLQRSFRMDNPDVTGYALPILASLALLAGGGVAIAARLLDRARAGLGRAVSVSLLSLAALGALCSASAWDRADCRCAERIANKATDALPPGSALLISDFNLLFMLDYRVQVENLDLFPVYLRDLDNAALRARLRAERPDLDLRLPATAALDASSLRDLRGPIFVDAGPHLDPRYLPPLRPAGLLWQVGTACTPEDLARQSRFFAPAPPRCGGGRIDAQSAKVVAWHALFQARLAAAYGWNALAASLLGQAWCASPEDGAIAAAAREQGVELPAACPAMSELDGRGSARAASGGRARSLGIALGLLLWALVCLALGPYSARADGLRWLAGMAGLAVVGICCAVV